MQDAHRQDALEAAVRDVMDSQGTPSATPRRSAQPTAKQPPRRLLMLVMLMIWAMIGWIWSARPAFLFGEQEVAVVSPAVDEASLRFALYLERSRVDAYRQRAGRLPTDLAETGPVEAGVTLVPGPDGYQLIGRRGVLELRLTDRMNADSFLGSSLDVLQRAASR
jgi:hypothetical protein